MKVDVGRCLVVVDTLEGVQAAKAADMHVLGFARDSYASRSEMERSGARLFDNMEELEEMIDFFERSL